tara:strand:+ start:137 stop:439 length:303 start_codon:yes stop_codon:yes gene_type:complete
MESNKKKRKIIENDDIDLDDYMNIDLEKYRKDLYAKMYNYEKMAKKKKEEIKEINKLIAKKCKETKGHKWVSEREPYMYGERFTYCEYCRTDYYNHAYYH